MRTKRKRPTLTGYLSQADIAERYHRAVVTIQCWRSDPKVAFPKPDLKERGRLLWLQANLEAWEQERHYVRRVNVRDARASFLYFQARIQMYEKLDNERKKLIALIVGKTSSNGQALSDDRA